MGFVWHVAVRYFRSTRADAHIRTLSRLTAGGLAVGTAALVLALAALAGFQDVLLDDLARHTPALQIELSGEGALGGAGADAAPTEAVRGLAELAAATNGVAGVQELLNARGWLADGDRPFAVEVLGYEKAPPPWIPIQAAPESGLPVPGLPGSGLIVPISVALRMGLAVGDNVRVVSPRPGLTPVGPRPRTRMLPVDLIYRSGRADEAADPVLMPLGQASALFARGDRRLDLTLAPATDPEDIAVFLRQGIDPAVATVTTRGQANRALLFVLRLEKGLVFSAVALIVAVASFALLAALSMVLSSKRSEVGVLAAMGAPPARLQRVFLLLGALLSVGGAGLGGALGAALAAFLDRYRVISTPSDVYVVDYVPFLVRGGDVLVVLAVTVLFTAAAALIGARQGQPSAPGRGDAERPHVISVAGVDKAYQDGAVRRHVLRGVDLEVARGETAAVVGPSGSGKSTLLNILGALDAPDAGSVRVAGVELTASRPSAPRRLPQPVPRLRLPVPSTAAGLHGA